MQEEVNQKTVALSIRTTKLTGKVLAAALGKVVRALQKHHQKALTPQGRQSVKKLMNHHGGKSAMPYVGAPKDFDRIAYIMDELCQDSVQIVALGTGDERYENMFRHFDWKYHGKVSAQIYYDESMSHRIYAASDAFLMPSLFEPCGLSQLMSLRYGTLPIVRETGGLKDTVEPYNEFEGTGTGFSFSNYNAHEMLSTIRYAERIYYDKKREWNKMVDRAMAKDFSWSNSARQYEEMYNWLIGE